MKLLLLLSSILCYGTITANKNDKQACEFLPVPGGFCCINPTLFYKGEKLKMNNMNGINSINELIIHTLINQHKKTDEMMNTSIANITKIQADDPSVSKSFEYSGESNEGNIPKIQNDDPVSVSKSFEYSGESNEGNIPKIQNDDPISVSKSFEYSGELSVSSPDEDYSDYDESSAALRQSDEMKTATVGDMHNIGRTSTEEEGPLETPILWSPFLKPRRSTNRVLLRSERGAYDFEGTRKDIITEKSLNAVQSVVEYLKEDILQRDIFRAPGHDSISRLIAKELNKGSPHLPRLLEENSVRDIAGGLVYFLMCLKAPLIPPYIQSLVLDPDNKSISPEVVAQDTLGLIIQEITGRQLQLLQCIFDLLHHVLKYTPTDELSGANIPIYMMPVFFNLQPEHILHWRRVAAIFVELIRLAPHQLHIDTASYGALSRNHLVVQNLRRPTFGMFGQQFLQQRLNDMNMVLRRYITQAGRR